MEKNAEVAPSNSRGSPDADALYCEECLRVDRSFNDIPNMAPTQHNPDRLVLSLKADPADIKADTTCPSCRDFLNIRNEYNEDVCNFELMIHGDRLLGLHSALLQSEESKYCVWSHDSYLLPRSDYPMRLRNDPATDNKTKNLPIVQIKSWLDTCERKHERCRSDPANELDMPLYLIDVVDECITLEPVSNVRYIALSYVWGNVKSTNLTSGNMEELRKPRSLSSGSHVAIVPQTIKDAMRLTADLDVRYLWVDCLCLIQNDPNLSFYLNRMHMIYANAFLTILVANKDNANGGINGYDTRSTGRVLPPGRVINYPNYVLGTDVEIRGALPWFSRAWTLQEGFSSRRVLVIDDRICLKCAEDCLEEGSSFGFKKFNFNLSMRMVGFLLTLCQASLTERKPDWQAYSRAAASFAPRKLSYDQDSMKAFLGVINFYTSLDDPQCAVNTRLLYGHPICKLSRALLWSSGEAILERRMLLRQDGSFIMPSWSWMAWRHDCHTMGSKPLGSWWPSGDDKASELQVPIVIYAQCGICLQKHQMTSEKCSNKASPERVKPEYLDPYLYIKAQRAQFRALCYANEHDGVMKPWQQWSTTKEASRRLTPGGTTNDAKRTSVGNMSLDQWPARLPWSEADALDFIGISCIENSGYSQVDALCVVPVTGRPGVFERLGIARIWKYAWDQAAQFDENIILG